MISADGWFDFAEQRLGLVDKVNGGRSSVLGFVAHSVEGYEHAIMGTLRDPARRASWHLTNLYDGRLWQHYPVYAQCWASGSGWPNNNFVAMEHEGVVGQPLTDAQVATTVRVIRELAALSGWQPRRPADNSDGTASLYEHRECTRFGSAATACPSGHIRWDAILGQLQEGDMSAEEQIELTLLRQTHRLVRALTTGRLVAIPGPTPETVEIHRVVDGHGQPFTPVLVVPVE